MCAREIVVDSGFQNVMLLRSVESRPVIARGQRGRAEVRKGKEHVLNRACLRGDEICGQSPAGERISSEWVANRRAGEITLPLRERGYVGRERIASNTSCTVIRGEEER